MRLLLFAVFLLTVAATQAQIHFKKVLIAAESFESAAVFDVNKDGHPDIISGAFWYEGPGFVKRHYIGAVARHGEFYDDFSTIPLDVNGDGFTDFITGGWWGNTVRWRENPGTAKKEWTEHIIGECGNVETTRAWDIDGDGIEEVVPNNPGKPLLCFKLNKSTGQFTKHQVADKQGHGIGFGDINGDGRGDLIISEGWLEAPNNPWKEKWQLHKEFQLGETGIPIIVADINGDGRNDMIVGQGHDYGLHWYEQKSEGGKRIWTKHAIDPFNSQYHTLMWEDIDGDHKPELITGKRYRAHNDNDPGSADPYGLYYFKWNGESFTKQIICYGVFGVGKGTGNYFAIADLRKTGRKDIVVAGKDGLFVFFNEL
jgi:FG-GAP repeat.